MYELNSTIKRYLNKTDILRVTLSYPQMNSN